MPDWKGEISRRLRGLKLAPAREAEILEEMSQHLEDRYKELLTNGAAAEEAHRVALKELSDETLLARGLRGVEQEVNRELIEPGGSGGDNFLASVGNDIRYGLRAFANNPGFTAVAVLTLALGIGANTAIFSMVNGIILRTLPYRAAGQLYAINEQIPQFISRSPWGPWFPVNPANFRLWQGQCPAASSMALIGPAIFNMTSEGEPRQVQGVRVSADFFSMMDISPQLGRTFLPEEDQLGRDHELILSAEFWRPVFNSDPHILGRSITLDNASYTVVGIMPENFRFPELPHLPISTPELFKPVGFQKWELWPGLGGFNYAVIARLKAGASPQQALAQLNVVEARIAREGDAHRGGRVGRWNFTAGLSQNRA
jgi:hypothetical protein